MRKKVIAEIILYLKMLKSDLKSQMEDTKKQPSQGYSGRTVKHTCLFDFPIDLYGL